MLLSGGSRSAGTEACRSSSRGGSSNHRGNPQGSAASRTAWARASRSRSSASRRLPTSRHAHRPRRSRAAHHPRPSRPTSARPAITGRPAISQTARHLNVTSPYTRCKSERSGDRGPTNAPPRRMRTVWPSIQLAPKAQACRPNPVYERCGRRSSLGARPT